MASVKENLIAARALIDTPEKWIKGSLENEDHTCFCAYGAIARTTNGQDDCGSMDHRAVLELRAVLPSDFVADPQGILDIAQFNDDPNTAHADVLALFDRAIAACDEQVAV